MAKNSLSFFAGSSSVEITSVFAPQRLQSFTQRSRLSISDCFHTRLKDEEAVGNVL